MSATRVAPTLLDFPYRGFHGVRQATLWRLPASAPLILLCHGGSSHRTAPEILLMAEAFTAQGLGHVLAVDGPVQGQNSPYPNDRTRVVTDWRNLWPTSAGLIDAVVEDWLLAVDAAGEHATANGVLGWCGVSMGTAYGIPLLARRTCAAAVLGMWANTYPRTAAIAAAAPHVRCPVLFVQRDEDQLFTDEQQCAVFDALGSTDKHRVHIPGRHSPMTAAEAAAACAFFARHLPTPPTEDIDDDS